MRSSLSLTTPHARRTCRGPPHPNLIPHGSQGHAVLPGRIETRGGEQRALSRRPELGLWWRSPRIGRGGDAKKVGRARRRPAAIPMRARPLAREPEWYTRGVS